MPGVVALDGGNEFAPENQAIYAEIHRTTGLSTPRLVILPTAATDNPRKAARSAHAFFRRLGYESEYIMTAGEESADDLQAAFPLERAHAIYLTDGNPLDAVRNFTGSETLAKAQRAWQSGAILMACGASAMALCDFYWDSGAWEHGLGLLKGIVALPHHERLSARFSAEKLRAGLSFDYVMLGLDEATGVILDGQNGRVLGVDMVTVYQGDTTQEYPEGGAFLLPKSVF